MKLPPLSLLLLPSPSSLLLSFSPFSLSPPSFLPLLPPLSPPPLSFPSLSLFSAAFTSNKLLVVVSEMYGDEREALDIVPVITTALLEEHQLVTGIIVVVDPGTIPINSRGEKQRVHLRDSFLADEVDPIYVAYNL